MSTVHLKHLVHRGIHVGVTSRVETDGKKGDFLLDQSKDGTTQNLHT